MSRAQNCPELGTVCFQNFQLLQTISCSKVSVAPLSCKFPEESLPLLILENGYAVEVIVVFVTDIRDDAATAAADAEPQRAAAHVQPRGLAGHHAGLIFSLLASNCFR